MASLVFKLLQLGSCRRDETSENYQAPLLIFHISNLGTRAHVINIYRSGTIKVLYIVMS